MIILGIDPGYDRVGWAILEKDSHKNCKVIACSCIQTKKADSIWLRYSQIVSELQSVLNKHKPEFLAIESIFFSKNQKTAIKVSEARGIIIGAILPYVKGIHEYTPNQIKLAVTGYGNSDKQSVDKMVRMQLKIGTAELVDDTMDAIAISFTDALVGNSEL